MAAPYGAKNSPRERSTVYESCKKIVEARNRLHKLQSKINCSDFELNIPMQETSKLQNENSNVFQIRKQFFESREEETNDNMLLLSNAEKMSNKSELCTENINNFLEKLSAMNQVLLKNKSDFEYNNDSIEMNSCLKDENLKMKIIVCPECDAQFEKKTEFTQHFKQNHAKKRGRPAVPVECNVCQKKFTCKKDYAIHFRIHSEKTYTCTSCKKMCFLNVPHPCKNTKFEKTKCSVWDACKKALTEKSFQQAPSENSNFFAPKLPISKSVVFININPNEVLKNLKTSSEKMKITSYFKESEIINKSSVNDISCDQDSVEQLFSECKNLNSLESDNLMNFQTETINVTEVDNTKFLCNISLKEVEEYEAHYSTHLLDEFCQIREGDEELHVCNNCGRCFTELIAFQAHKFTHVN